MLSHVELIALIPAAETLMFRLRRDVPGQPLWESWLTSKPGEVAQGSSLEISLTNLVRRRVALGLTV